MEKTKDGQMKRICVLLLIFFGFFDVAASERMTCEQVRQRLAEGNDRYVKGLLEHPHETSYLREAVASKQYPFAVIVGCSDSRVPPEIIFDQSLGDLFVVRVAGNVIGNIELESIEYAALHLGTPCIVVMGHQSCGAVDAVVEGNAQGMPAIAKLIKPSVEEAKKNSSDDVLSAAIKENAIRMQNFLLNSKQINKLYKEKKIGVRAAYYDLSTGAVEWLK